MNLAGSGEWSDDAVKSGSATGFSDPECEDDRQQQAKHLNNNFDPVNVILDKIDAELSSMHNVQRKVSGGHVEKLGVQPSTSKEPDIATDERPGEEMHRSSVPSDLDSVSAKQLDEKFKEILHKKKGEHLENLRASFPQSDADTIKTEDYENRFRNAMVYNSDDSSTLESDDDRSDDFINDPPPQPCNDPPPNTDIRQIPEDEEVPDSVPKKKLPLQSKTIGSLNPAVPLLPKTEHSPRRKSRRRTPYASDAESVKTEDFETRFQNLLVKPLESGGDTGVDSDINDPLHKKVREILRVSAPYESPPKNGYLGNRVRRERERSPLDERPSARSQNSRPSTKMNREELEKESSRIQREMDRRRKHAPPTHRVDKSPTRTAMDLSGTLQRSPSAEDLRAQLPPGCPMPLTGRFSPNPQRSASATSTNEEGPKELDGRPSSPFERSRKYSDQQNSRRRNFSPDRSVEVQLDPPTMTSSPRDKKSLSSHRNYDRPNPSKDADQKGHSRRTEIPIDRYADQDEDMSDDLEKRLFDRNSSPLNSEADFSNPHPSEMNMSPRYISGSQRNSRSGNAIESPIQSNALPKVAFGRISPILNGIGNPKLSDDRFTVSFQENEESGRRSPSHLDLAYPGSRRPPVSSWNLRGTSSAVSGEDEPKSLKKTLMDLRTAEKQLKKILAQTEDARTQLMLTEFKRDNKQRDYERMSEDLNRRKRELKSYEDQLRSRTGDIRQMDQSHVDEKTLALIQENESLKHRLRQSDGLELERDELVRQLELAKEDLFNEQKQARNKIEELKDEIENLVSQSEEAKNPNMGYLQRVRELEETLESVEKEKTNLIRDKASLYEELQELQTKLRMSQRGRSGRGEEPRPRPGRAEELRSQLDKVCNELSDLKQESKKMEETNINLREQLLDLRRQLEREKTLKDGLLDDHKTTLQSLRKEMDSAMVQMRENLFLDKQQALEKVREELDKSRREASAKSEDKLSRAVVEHKLAIKKKDEEIGQLIEVVRRLENDRSSLERKIKEDAEQKIQEAIHQERHDKEKEWLSLREKEQQQNKQTVKRLTNELEQERQHKGSLIDRISHLNKELEENRQQQKQAEHERMMAVARARDQVRHEMLEEMDRMREKLKQEHRQEIDRLQATLRCQEEELCNLRAERKLYTRPELQNTLDRVERTIVNEINEECRRNSGIIGSTPRKVNLNNFTVENDGYTPNGRSRTPTTAALTPTTDSGDGKANLRVCNQDLRNHVKELKKELEQQKSALMRVEQEKEDVVKNVKYQLQKERNKELEKIKESFVKPVPVHNYNGYHVHKLNNDTLNTQYNREKPVYVPTYQFNPRGDSQNYEIDRLEREIKRLAENQNRMMNQRSPSSDDIETQKMLNHLKGKIAVLQQENNALRSSKYNSYSVPDLTNAHNYYTPSHREKMANMLEQRSKEALLDSETAAEQQQRSRNVMSQKMMEMTRLQNSLTDQAQDLIHLSKSYHQLNSRSSSPVRDLNSTR